MYSWYTPRTTNQLCVHHEIRGRRARWEKFWFFPRRNDVLLRNSFAKYLVLLILSELFNFSFNINIHISSVINECVCMVHYWKDSNKKKYPFKRHHSFWILSPQIPLGITWDWCGDYKPPGCRQSFRRRRRFCHVIPGL